MKHAPLTVLLVLVLVNAGWAQKGGLSGREGHARTRFPLAVRAAPFDDVFERVVARVVADWNTLTQEVLDVRAFGLVGGPDHADVTIAIGPRMSVREAAGIAKAHAGADREIIRPVRITVFGPPVENVSLAIDREARLYRVIAHELGHALGLSHVDDLRSLMCCVHWPTDRSNLLALWEAQRRPDVRSVRDQLAEHYADFWAMDVP